MGDGYGTNPSVSVGNTTAKYVWTSSTSAAPYQVKTSAETLSKTGTTPPTIAYHRSIAVLDPNTGAWLEVRLDKLSVKTKAGEEFVIPFVNAKEDSLTLTPANGFINLASSHVTLPTDAESLFVRCVVSGQNLPALKTAGAAIRAELVIAGTNDTTFKLPMVNTTSASLPETKFLLSTSVTSFAGIGFSLRTDVFGLANKKSSLIASLGHIYEVTETPLQKTLEEIANVVAPRDFSLLAHPNPFSANGTFGKPVTQIRFAMKDKGLAALRVYNLSGQLVRELVNEQRAAGEYTASWDGRDDRGVVTASGVYFIRLETGNQVKLSKVTLVR